MENGMTMVGYQNIKFYYCPLNLFLPPYSQLLSLDKPSFLHFLWLSAKNRVSKLGLNF